MIKFEVPVQLSIEVAEDTADNFLVAVLKQEGILRVGMCPVCFALVPLSKIDEHTKINIHSHAK
jgi:hypothetical protein